jgi:thiol-disulfide isomerase/thioredoxin
MSPSRRRALVALFLVVALLTGCAMLAEEAAQSLPDTPVAAETRQDHSAASVPLTDGDGLPHDYIILLYGGDGVDPGIEIALSDLLSANMPLVLNLWAGQCPSCRAEMPDFQAAYEAYAGRIVMFGVDVGALTRLGTREDALALLAEYDITYPTGTTIDIRAITGYGVSGMPTTLFITPDGRVVAKWTGLLTYAKLIELTDMLLEASR